MQFAEISTLAVGNTDNLGQGGPETAITPSPINDNSFLASNPSSTDYIETSGFKRSSVSEYTVQPGDLLSFIASDYGVSVSSIIWANGLRDADSLKLGQVLKIPPVSGVIHLVKKGDTVASIAKKYTADEAKILEFNVLPQSGELTIGDEVIVPDGQIKSTYVASSGSSVKPFSYLPDLGDYFMKPVSGGYNWGRIHGRNGVDVANSCGTPIYAAADGSVAIADASGYNGGFGKYIKIVHPNGTETLYAHATKLLVSAGESAQRGQMIALMGSTGRSTGCHLHFEVHGAHNPLIK
jgi:murein DD-endopeptidase MepM/ murein hydrolase activator NlpD